MTGESQWFRTFRRWLGAKVVGEEAPPIPPGSPNPRGPRELGQWLPYLMTGPGAGVVGIIGYAWSQHHWRILAVGLLVAGGAFVTGGLLGFLFGIPRSVAGSEPPEPTTAVPATAGPARFRANTNLEQISDWLTKILVGLGLVELGTLMRNGRDLISFLAPGLGESEAVRPAFTFATLVLFSVSGFLIFYLVTRIFLPREFARAETLIDSLKQQLDAQSEKIEQVEKAQRDDARALALASRQLDPGSGGTDVPQAELDDAIASASQAAKTTIFNLARQQRQRTWNARDDQERQRMERTIPIFRALVASDPKKRFHRNFAELGFALKDQREPDLPGAEALLTEAITIRDRQSDWLYPIYEFNRAICRIGTDPRFAEGKRSELDVRARILDDLRLAAVDEWLREEIRKAEPFAQWMRLNDVSAEDLERDVSPKDEAREGGNS